MIKRLTKHLLVRYVISGGIATVVNLSLFFILHQIYHIYYILASVVAFSIGFLVSLILQKFWTFQDHSLHKFHHQVAKYLLTSLFGLSVDIIVLYLCVEYFGFYALVGQIVAGAVSACFTFFLSRHFVFKISQKSSGIEIETDIKSV
jgi:putative flippase GtrA